MTRRYLVADLFCGAGGSSTGAQRAVRAIGGEMELVAVNHWPVAIETHQRNHPLSRHYVEDVTAADPERIVPEGRLDLLMASPECRFYSRARGGKPVHDQSRMNPWIVQRWLTALDVRCVLIENVPEFTEWGPLLDDGRPDKSKKGVYFEAWVKALWELGYAAEWRMLNAANFGDATTRIRFFLQARKDGQPIRWPEPTHSKNGADTMLGGLPRWRAAREIIDWSNPGRSLLDDPRYQKKPLSEKTRRRIARGLEKFAGPLSPFYIRLLGLDGAYSGVSSEDGKQAQPFVMGKQSSPAIRGMDEPVPTLTTEGGLALIQPLAEPFMLGQQSGGAPRSAEDPVPTVSADGAISLVQPLITQYNGNGGAAPVDKPLPTQTTKARFGLATPTAEPFILNRHGENGSQRVHSVEGPTPTVTTRGAGYLVEPFIVPQFGEAPGQAPRVHDADEPLPAVTSHGAGALVNPLLVEVNHGGDGRAPRSVDDPLGTLTTKRGTGLVSPLLVQTDQTGGNGSYVRPVDSPVPTIVTSRNIGLAEPVIEAIQSGQVDPRRVVLVDGEPYLLDIRFRMLQNRELARAMGFDDEESQYEFSGTVSDITKQIGNAVPVNTAAALVGAVLGPVAEKEDAHV